MKIAIAGTGRSGTSLLVQLLGEWGFSVPPREGNWSESAQAGLESRIGGNSRFEVDKHPWAFQYLGRLDEATLARYDAFIVPIRDRSDAAISRSVQERLHRARRFEDDHWMWDSWGPVPGGAIARTDRDAMATTLAVGLWDLLEKATRAGVHPILLHFPRFATDFEYLWNQLGPLVQTRLPREAALAGWTRVVDLDKVRISPSRSGTADPQVRELQALVDLLRQENRTLSRHLKAATDGRENALAQQVKAISQQDNFMAQRD